MLGAKTQTKQYCDITETTFEPNGFEKFQERQKKLFIQLSNGRFPTNELPVTFGP